MKLLPVLRKSVPVTFILVVFIALFNFSPTGADELDDVTAQLAKQQKQLADLEKQKNQLARDISSASISLSQVSSQLTDAEGQLSAIEKQLASKSKTLARWESERDALIRELYKQGKSSGLELFLAGDNLDTSTKNLYYYDENLNLLKERITSLNGEILVFEANKASAQKLRDELAALRTQYSSRLASSQRQYASTSSQLSAVKSSIKNLTAKQAQLILEKFAASGGSETVGDNPPASEPLPAPGFAPAYMMGTYGYPHRIGMSQYGAKGRALKSQGYQAILGAYYGMSATRATNIPSTIKVNGCNEYGQCWSNYTYEFEEYLKHLYEMPTSWPAEALKAQAIAARTYALRAAKPICPSQSCQVIKKEINSAAWQQAVEATRGLVVGGNNPVPTFYHSTAGGYTISRRTWVSYWVYNDGIKDFYNSTTAYEQIGGSPYYHTGWGHRTGVKGQYNPWMTQEEFADIFNAFLLCKAGSQPYQLDSDCSYMPHLSPIDSSDPNKWSMSQVRSKLVELGITPVTSINAVVTSYIGGVAANTASIYVMTAGNTTYSFSGRYFRDIFNLRSRGTLSIKTYRYDVGYCASSGCTGPTFK